MNNPKTRDDDQRSSIANKGPQNATEKEARRVVEGGQADRRSEQKQRSEKSQKEGPAAYAPRCRRRLCWNSVWRGLR